MFDKRPAEGTYKIFNKAPLSLNPPKPQIVDLLDGVKYGQIAGYRNNGSSPNNLWIVEHKAGSENEIFLINKATRQYAGPSVPPEGQTLRGTDDITVWTVVEVRKNEYFIMLEYDLAWTLPDDKNRTPIVLDAPMEHDARQIWVFQKQQSAIING